jgi:hypothetical protein
MPNGTLGAGQPARRCYPEALSGEGENMRLIATLVLIFAFHGQATAQTPQCQSIPKASDRLACYDRTTPPTGVPKTPPMTGKTAAASPSADQAKVVDMLAVENSKLDAKLKTICRGC